MASETDILRERLLTRDTVFLGRGTKKALLKFHNFVATLAEGEDFADARRKAAASTTRELRLFALEVRKAGSADAACARELAECDELEAETTASVATVTDDIERLQEELVCERRMRGRKEEYESLAKVINALPSRKSSAAELEKLSAEVSSLDRRADAIARLLARRGAQYELLLQTIDDLQRADAEGNEIEAALLAQSENVHGGGALLDQQHSAADADDAEMDDDVVLSARDADANDADDAEEAGEIGEIAEPPPKRTRASSD